MTCIRSFSIRQYIFTLLAGVIVIVSCNEQDRKDVQGHKTEVTHNYRDIFGEKYTTMGDFSGITNDKGSFQFG
jgi:hypothetical protein